ncbi:MAG: hypothetical protein QF918_03875 [Pirellulaceae bacterium]|jgi:hypothetical protein|nr:hypothetical protein [Pirellulaceae bacterium]MDP6555272.1 hypothetical protein [Pirellulaceae bacterium]MDP6720844.1 hypothetical protein [Pirellulaceae bacterium]
MVDFTDSASYNIRIPAFLCRRPPRQGASTAKTALWRDAAALESLYQVYLYK